MTNNELSAKPQDKPISVSQSFAQRILREYAATAPQGITELSDSQRRIIQGYFVVIDRALKTAEEERLRKNKGGKYVNELPYIWKSVNMTDLALDAVHYARMGLDMQEKNHLFPIPYQNKKGGFYDITFMLGYNGIRYISEKYSMYPPKGVTIELVYSNDVFRPIKKAANHPVETYEFEITSPFDRGDIVGGFGYIEYDEPAKNTLVIMSRAAMDKRKPEYASANFWGGKITKWVNGKPIEVEAEGWKDEMYYKTLVREVYSPKHISRDPSKIDDNYQYIREREIAYAETEVEMEALENANRIAIDAPAAAGEELILTQEPERIAEPAAAQTAQAPQASIDANEVPEF
ncbi:hypothetical protein FACS1894216_05030 [Synergistales bacterium]|nr:hypothetical protein FACS1894216_05030 [Synergistales bacterium]